MSSNAILGWPEPLRERRAVLGQAREHEAAVGLDPRRALHVLVVAFECCVFIAARQRHRLVRAVVVEAPGVIRAGERVAGVAVACAADLRAAVGAAVVEDVDRPILAPHHDHRLPADLEGPEVARLLHLRLVAGVDPAALEDPLDLQVEDVLVGVAEPVHPVGLDQRLQVGDALLQHGEPPKGFLVRERGT